MIRQQHLREELAAALSQRLASQKDAERTRQNRVDLSHFVSKV
jgi:hypothetical protein